MNLEALGLDTTYVFSKVRDVYAATQRAVFRSGGASAPVHVFFLVTARCNLACEMCYLIHQGSLNTGRERELEREEIAAVVAQTAPFTIITFSGGEPFARRDFLQILADTAARRRVYVITNGTRLRPEDTARVVDLAPRSVLGAGLMALGISIVGPQEVHDEVVRVPGSFQRVGNTFKALREERSARGGKYPLLNLKMVLTGTSAPRLLDIIPIIEEWRPDIFTLQLESSMSYGFYEPVMAQATTAPFSPEDLDRPPADIANLSPALLEEVLSRFSSAWGDRRQPRLVIYPQTTLARLPSHLRSTPDLEKAWCSALWTDVMIGPWGDVSTCLAGSMGNLRQHTLSELMNHPKYRQFRSAMRVRRISPACRGCCMLQEAPG
jgi:MoaA/NifB/PqqE/SkfB family radical SAM enzyme